MTDLVRLKKLKGNNYIKNICELISTSDSSHCLPAYIWNKCDFHLMSMEGTKEEEEEEEEAEEKEEEEEDLRMQSR